MLHSLSFVDDPTRMLRAARLEQRLGFKIEDRTLELMHQALPLLDRVSGERIRSELDLTFGEERSAQIMARLQSLGLLEAIHPELVWDAWLAERFVAVRTFAPPVEWRLKSDEDVDVLYYALLFFRLGREASRAALGRLHFPSSRGEVVLEANEIASLSSGWTNTEPPSKIVAALDECRETALVAAWIGMQGHPVIQDYLAGYLAKWRWVTPTVDGMNLRELGLPPGSAYGRILDSLRAAWLDGVVRSEKEENQLLLRLVEVAKTGG